MRWRQYLSGSKMDRADYLTISERVTNDWKEKLEVLRNHHRYQSREQQTQHLEELRVLQEDLLKDIAHFMTIVRVDRGKNVDSSQDGTDAFEEVNSLQEQTMRSVSSAQGESILDNMAKMVDKSDTSLVKMSRPPLCLPHTSSLISSMKAEHPQDSTIDTSVPSLNVFSTAFSNGTLTEPSVHTSAVAVASQAMPSCGGEGGEGREQEKILTDVVNKLQDVAAINEEPSRVGQVAKFDRHVQDLRTFYESEISVLKEKLSKMENCGSSKDLRDSLQADMCEEEVKTCTTQSTLNSYCASDDDDSGGKVLQEFCKRLQEQLEDNEM